MSVKDDSFEERLARLEEAVKLIQFDQDIDPEKPVTEEKCQSCEDMIFKPKVCPDKPSKPSECEHQWSTLWCVKCGKPNNEGITDTISIPRDVAEKWLMEDKGNITTKEVELFRAIKSALDN